MEQEEEEIKRNINNILCDTSFESPVIMNVQKKYANLSLERKLAAGVLAEIVEIFKRCTIQSDKQVEKNNWFRGTCWREEMVKKRFFRTGWWNKCFQETICGCKQSKKRSKGNYSHYQRYLSYSHYQRNFNTKIIDQRNPPSRRRTNYPASHRQCGGRAREFEPAPEGFPTGECHGRGAELRVYLPDSW